VTPTREVQMQALDREMLGGGELFALVPVSAAGAENHQMSQEIHELLQEFNHVLEEPHGIPPSRSFDHRIPLKESTAPVNVQPYRYAHFQKM
jgi:hypothetical protein